MYHFWSTLFWIVPNCSELFWIVLFCSRQGTNSDTFWWRKPTISDKGVRRFGWACMFWGSSGNGYLIYSPWLLRLWFLAECLADWNTCCIQPITLNVYATKSGYQNSDVTTYKFPGINGDVDCNGMVNVADHVKLSEIIMNQWYCQSMVVMGIASGAYD